MSPARILLKMQIVMQLTWGGAQVSTFLKKSQSDENPAGVRTHFDQLGYRWFLFESVVKHKGKKKEMKKKKIKAVVGHMIQAVPRKSVLQIGGNK